MYAMPKLSRRRCRVSIISSVVPISAIGEAMEGVGVALAAKRWGMPFAELRTISNLVGRYEPKSWSKEKALDRLSEDGA